MLRKNSPPPLTRDAELQAYTSGAEQPSTHPLEPLFQRWSKRVSLLPEDKAALFAMPYTRRTLGKDAYLVREGQPISECAVLLRGMAFRQKLLRDGRRQILAFHVQSEFVDLQNAMFATSDHNVQSLNRSEFAVVSKNAVIELGAAYPRVRRAMSLDALSDASIYREWIVNIGRRNSRSRIAHLLCEMVFRLDSVGEGRDGPLDFPLTQEQIADATGLTSVHTNRILQTLRRDRLIGLNGRSLTVLNWNSLREAGDFDELYLHQVH